MLIEAIAAAHPTTKDSAATAQLRKEYESKVTQHNPCVDALERTH